eukprot:COSAG05_NODE_280_length_12288_cov_4.797933_7_plen_114_part_00
MKARTAQMSVEELCARRPSTGWQAVGTRAMQDKGKLTLLTYLVCVLQICVQIREREIQPGHFVTPASRYQRICGERASERASESWQREGGRVWRAVERVGKEGELLWRVRAAR